MRYILNGGDIQSFIESLFYTIPAVLIALTFHEFAHAYVAYRNGDPTARDLGRMTLNPFAHIDTVGLLCMIVCGFGWAKPVPVNPGNYHSYRKGEITVSLAGVTMNLILAIIGAFAAVTTAIIAMRSNPYSISPVAEKIYNFCYYFMFLNCSLCVFNLIPIYPLDGYHVFEVLLGNRISTNTLVFMHKYGYYILIGLIIVFDVIDFSPIGIAVNAISDWLLNLAAFIINIFA